MTEFARGVDTREVKSHFDNSRPLVSALRLPLEFDVIQASLKILPSEARHCSNRKPSTEPEVQFHLNFDVSWPGKYCQERLANDRSRLESSMGGGRKRAGGARRLREEA